MVILTIILFFLVHVLLRFAAFCTCNIVEISYITYISLASVDVELPELHKNNSVATYLGTH